MKHKKRVTKSAKKRPPKGKPANGAGGRKAGRHHVSMGDVLEFYKPIKKPVTLRLDADVLAWFRRDGRRYQTRINSALRSLMEREMKRK
jgi:uncharacterized protein (DUF4415 family)